MLDTLIGIGIVLFGGFGLTALWLVTTGEPVKGSGPRTIILRRYKALPSKYRYETIKSLKERLDALDAHYGIEKVNNSYVCLFRADLMYSSARYNDGYATEYGIIFKKILTIEQDIRNKRSDGVAPDISDITNGLDNAHINLTRGK